MTCCLSLCLFQSQRTFQTLSWWWSLVLWTAHWASSPGTSDSLNSCKLLPVCGSLCLDVQLNISMAEAPRMICWTWFCLHAQNLQPPSIMKPHCHFEYYKKNGKTILQCQRYMTLVNIQCVAGVYSLIFSVFEVCVLLCVLSSLPSHRNVSYEDLLGALQQYGTCQQRLGQWCAGKRKVLKTERSEFKQSGEFRKVVTPAFLALSLTTPLPHFCPSPWSLTD